MQALPEPAEIEELLALATDDEKAALTELLELRLSIESPLALAQRCTPGTQPFPHTRMLDQYLVALVDHALYLEGSEADLLHPELPNGISDVAVWEEFPDPIPGEEGAGRFIHPTTGEEAVYNLAISMPPQHGKSYMVSHHLPAWFLIRFPHRPVAIVSYEYDFATTWASKVRNLIDAHPEYGLQLDPSTRGKGEWLLKGHGGGMMSAGRGGPITGRPTGLLVMDDLLKNSTEAMSETVAAETRDWWHSTAKTRNQSPRALPGQEPWAGVRVLMSTRWSETDPIGYTQRAEPEEWFYLNLPAISEGTDPDTLPEGHRPDPLGRPAGAALAPMLHSRQVLERIKVSGDPEDPDSGGAFWFEANYQGYPNVEGQGIFARPFHLFERRGPKYLFSDGYTCHEHEFRHYLTVDLAASVKTRADFTVFMHLGQAPDGRLVVLDIYRERLETPDHEDKLLDWLEGKPRMMFVGIEDKTFGTVLIQHLLRRGKVPVRPLKADVDKVTRAIPAGQACKNRRVWWDRDEEWRARFEAELTAFPNGAHDDMVDALAYGVQVWETLPGAFRPAEKNDQSPEAAVRRHKDRILRKRAKKRARHPEIGRL